VSDDSYSDDRHSRAVDAATGRRPDLLAEPVSLATPLTLGQLTGRDTVARVLRQIAAAFVAGPPEYVAPTPESDIVTFTGHADGHPIGLLARLHRAADGTYTDLELFARPWPFVAIARGQLATQDVLFRDTGLTRPYAPAGPHAADLISPPALPGLAPDVVFHSPVLTATAQGRDLVGIVLKAVGETYGTPRYRWAAQTDEATLVACYDGTVHGHVLQIAAVLGLNPAGEIADMRIYSRPWPVTALFRGEVYKLLGGTLGDEFWQGEHPLAALGEQ
jgi:hypothetical protein